MVNPDQQTQPVSAIPDPLRKHVPEVPGAAHHWTISGRKKTVNIEINNFIVNYLFGIIIIKIGINKTKDVRINI